MAVHLKRLDPATLSQIRCEYWIPTGSDAGDVLIVAFHGVYRPGSLGNPDADYMRGQVMAGLVMYRPMCLLLDFRKLEYEWGNSLLGIFQDVDDLLGNGTGRRFPVLSVASPQSAAALHSLLKVEAPSPFHLVDFDLALQEACRQAEAWSAS